jgi:hypothetical protein
MHVVGIGAGGCCAFLHVVHRVDQGGLVAFSGGLILDMMLMLVYVALVLLQFVVIHSIPSFHPPRDCIK